MTKEVYKSIYAAWQQAGLLLLLLLVPVMTINAQAQYKSYAWDANPVPVNGDTLELKNGAAILSEKRIMEVFLNPENIFEEMYVFHQKTKVTTSDAVDIFNKIYIPLEDVLEIVSIKARFISPSGKITELPQKSIKEVENLDNNGNYKMFAIEGAEVGGEVEYFYILRRKFEAYQGIYIQGNTPKYNVDVVFSYPSKLEYDIRSYNGLSEFEVSQDPAVSENTRQFAHIDHIPGLSEEPYGYYDCHRMRYEYTMAYNKYNGILRRYSWSKAGERYSSMYEFTNKETQAIKGIFKKVDKKNLDDKARIRNLENWMKTNAQINRDIARMDLDKAIELGQFAPYDATRLMIGFCQLTEIDFELVLTCENPNRVFDPSYNAWNFLYNFCIYFPGSDDFLVPSDPMSRIGVRPVNYMGNYGLFMKPVAYNEKVKQLAYDIKQLPVDPPLQNIDSMSVKLTVDTEELTIDASFDRLFTGFMAQQFQSFWHMVVDEDSKKDILNSLFNMGDENVELKSYELENSAPEDIAVNPLHWHVEQTADALIEVAGDDLIVHIGKVIGEQAEMYQEEERKLPVSIGFLHTYYRTIEMEIPEGYEIENAESLNMKVTMDYDGKESSAFLSSYTIEGNKLRVYSEEFYRDYHYPVEEFEAFRKVVNAAANFNKRTIVLKKTGA
ncbi:DUF3857 domain-containing protein [Carboxylicivirga sp. RSCT41]|uniref:DUF3857 domain-containing protein n=1 Tax=Carboxylicivirga agarovorans TaxID=3417570 RepID=UPI003D33FAC4